MFQAFFLVSGFARLTDLVGRGFTRFSHEEVLFGQFSKADFFSTSMAFLDDDELAFLVSVIKHNAAHHLGSN